MAQKKPEKRANQTDKDSKTTADFEDGPIDQREFTKLHQKIQAEFQTLRAANSGGHTNGREDVKQSKTAVSGDGLPASQKKGKKRNLSGKIKPAVVAHEPSALEQEVFELGGSREDIDLLAEVESASEVEGTERIPERQKTKAGKDRSLEAGLSNILKEIALAQGEINELQEEAADLDEQDEQDESDGLLSREPPANDAIRLNSLPLDGRTKKAMQFKPICEARPDWFNVDPPPSDEKGNGKQVLTTDTLESIHVHAQSLLRSDNERFQQQSQSSSSHNFYTTVITSGTLSDKISALTLAVQESPVHNVKALETLIGLAKKRNRAQAIDTLRALKDLFAQGSLLPGERKLHNFVTNPHVLESFAKTKSWKSSAKLPRGVKEEHLVIWAYESWLKDQYFDIIKTLEVWSNDEIEFAKSRALTYVYELLKEKPEQEANLLRLLINKLGDRTKKVASQASYQLMQLIAAHPAMEGVVISAVESDFIFRPGQSFLAKYYAVVTLNQTVLNKTEHTIAKKLLDIYFALFVGLLKPVIEDGASINNRPKGRGEMRRQKQQRKNSKHDHAKGESQEAELREKLISALLTGVNRAYPYIDRSESETDTHIDTLFKITHSSNFNTSIQAMVLIQQLCASQPASADRFYRTLYESLLDARLVTSSNQQLYLNLLHRSLKADLSVKRVKAFVKRIFQILSLHEPHFICGAFFLLADLQKTFPSLQALVDQPEEHGEDLEERFHDVEDDDDANATTHPDRARVIDANPSTHPTYDPRKRDPLHAAADTTCAWDLLPFLSHFHPTISLNASLLLSSNSLPGTPDLSLHTLSHFLDRFVYRNPKLRNAGWKGSSLMQPMASDDTKSVLVSSSGAARRQAPVNTERFAGMEAGKVGADEVFFHRYFRALGRAKRVERRKKDGDVDADREDGASAFGSGDEEEVWKAMVESAQQLEAEVDEDGLDEDELEMDLDDSGSEGVEVDGWSDMEGGEGQDAEVPDAPVVMDGEAAGGSDESDVFPDFDDDDEEEEEVSEDQEDSVAGPPAKKQKKGADRRKNLKTLPTFASAADYAAMIDDDRDEDLG